MNIELRHLCDLLVELGDPIELGTAARGADWQTVFADGSAELDTRYSIETHDGAVVDIRNFGFRHGPPEVIQALARGESIDPNLYYMRTHLRFETGDERYLWLNQTICVGTGAREPASVRITIFEVL